MTTYFFEEVTTIQELPDIIIASTNDIAEQEELLEIVKSTIHHRVLDQIFRELDVVQQHEFVTFMEMADDQTSIIEKLKELIVDVEQKILLKVRQAEQEIIEQIKEQN